MLAKKKPIIEKASETVFKLSKEEEVRLQCQAREDYYKTQNDFHSYYKKQLAEKDSALAEKDSALAEKDAIIAELKKKLENLGN